MTTQERNDLYSGFESLSFTPGSSLRGCTQVTECCECVIYQIGEQELFDEHCYRCTVDGKY